jgi:hypothetical protein
MTTSADPFPLFYQLNWGHDDVSLLFDAYYDNAWKSSHAGSNFRIRKASNKMTFGYARGLSPGSSIMQWSPAIEIDASTGATSLQSIVVNDRIRVGSPSGLARWSLTGTNGSYLQGPHVSMATSADPFPLFYQLNWGHDDISLLFDAYYEGAWKSSHSGSNFRIRKASNKLQFSYASGLSSGSSITQWLPALEINATTGATTLPNLKAPAGQKYFVCIDDAGVLSSQPTPCQ